MNANVFRHRLKEAMSEKGIRQSALIRACADVAPGVIISRSDISRYLSGQSVPRPTKMEAIAKALDVPYGWLSGDSDAAPPKEVYESLQCLCGAARCPDVYVHAPDHSGAYIVYVVRPSGDDLNLSTSFFRAVNGIIEAPDDVALATRALKAIRAGRVEREMLERLLPKDDEPEPKTVTKTSDEPKDVSADAPVAPTKPKTRIIIHTRVE